MELFWELRQQQMIGDAQNAASRAHRRAEQSEDNMRARIDSLTLTCAAMWSLLRDRLGVTQRREL